ncbi:MAG: EamA family transporter RarD [Pelovirga sp.]
MKKLSPQHTATLPGAVEQSRVTARQGVFYGLAAYLVWGMFPVYFKALAGATPLEIVCHRVVWSAALLLVIVGGSRQLGKLWNLVRNPAKLLVLCGSTLLISANWFIFLYAVERGDVLQSSLGYFITPLISVLLGCLVLRERLSPLQMISVGCAAAGVLTLTLYQGQLPLIALSLGFSFGTYGLLRKMADIEALVGLTVETLLLTPLCLAYLLFLFFRGDGAFGGDALQLNLLLPLAGAVTVIPLLLFVGAARRVRLATVGFLQYITPTMHFILAVGLYREPFSHTRLLSFVFIWMGLLLYSWDALATSVRLKKTAG